MLQTNKRTSSPALRAPAPPLSAGERDGARGRVARLFDVCRSICPSLIASQYERKLQKRADRFVAACPGTEHCHSDVLLVVGNADRQIHLRCLQVLDGSAAGRLVEIR